MADDLRSLRDLLREAIAATRLTSREVEDALEIGHGKLERLLNGQMEIRVRHILALANILKVSPGDFLILGCPGAVEAAQNELVEWLSPPTRRRAAKAARSGSTEDIAKLVRITIREELARLRRGPNGPEDSES
jgi:transcriptional regulator with XRE-family HTH domain